MHREVRLRTLREVIDNERGIAYHLASVDRHLVLAAMQTLRLGRPLAARELLLEACGFGFDALAHLAGSHAAAASAPVPQPAASGERRRRHVG